MQTRRHNEPHPGEIAIQTRAGSRLIGRRIIEHIRDVLGVGFKEFIEAQCLFFLATADDEGRLDCNFRGGPPGFVRVVDDRTLLFPDYNGNGSFMSLGNLAVNPRVGMLFIDFEHQRRVRVNGRAEILDDPDMVSRFPGAERIVSVTVEQAFPNCSRYIPRMVPIGPPPKDWPTP
jgi:predicted pyridoxine 5'-phosphate oxidase superfamily flavin-nucleotide-binding protein